MAQSRKGKSRQRHIRKLKRLGTQAKHVLKSRTVDYFNVVTALLGVLAQSGGEITITQGTASQAVQEFVKGQLSWAIVPGKVEGEFVVRLVTREAEKVAEPIEIKTTAPVDLDLEGVPDPEAFPEVIGQIGRDDVD